MALSELIERINALRKEWDVLQPISKENDYRLWQKLRLEWDYNSNHIEGNTLTYGETILLLINGKTTGDHELREFEEMKAHDVAIHAIKEWSTETSRELNEADIRNLNKIILKEPYWKEAITYDGQPTRRQIKIGDYKEFPNSVRLKNGELFHYASPNETPKLMQELMDWYKKSKNENPIILAAEFHYRFIRIHPFDDGNGRIARLLANYVLMQNGFPPVIIKSADKSNYLTALQKADAGDREAFQEYMGEQLIWSLEVSIKATKGESIDEPEDLDKEIAVLKKDFFKKDVLQEKATSKNIIKAIEDNIIPLFILIENQGEKLIELFFDFNRRVNFFISGEGSERQLGDKNSNWDTIKINWLHNQIKKENKRIQSFKYYYELRGFRKSVSAESFSLQFDVFFDEYNYKIVNQYKNVSIALPYGKNLTEVELRNIISPLFKDIIDRIKLIK